MDAEHAHDPPRGAQRQVEPLGRGQRIGRLAGHAALIEDPLGHRLLAGVEEEGDALGCPLGEAPGLVRQQEQHLAQENRLNVAGRGLEDLVAFRRRRQVAAHGVEGRRALLPLPGGLGLLAQAHGEGGDHQRGDEHHGEGQQVLGVRDGERQ